MSSSPAQPPEAHQPADNQLANKSQAWSALFSEPMSELVKRYTASVDFDKRLWAADIEGSLAHADMLAAQGIIGAEDLAAIRKGMAQIREEITSGSFEWHLDLEDVHLNIEARLTDRWSASPASGCTPAARATTRWPPTSACGCATRSTRSSACWASCSGRAGRPGRSGTPTPSCPASPTCRWPSR